MEQRDENIDPQTGEILSGDVVVRAADGGIMPGVAPTGGSVLDMIEDGQFSADLYGETREMVKKMVELAEATGNKQKGTITIKLVLSTEGDVFNVEPSFKVTPPTEKRRKTLLWPDETGRLSRSQPRQGPLFGVRRIDGAREVRSV
jgi:hypothetical protein